MAHIWACPPSEGDDYIFHCHPQEQKIPKPKRLQEWYKKMLDKGMVERIVLDYKVSILFPCSHSDFSLCVTCLLNFAFWCQKRLTITPDKANVLTVL